MLKIAICDDCREDRERVFIYTKEYCSEKSLQAEIAVYDHPDKLLTECEKTRPHIYILDIVMPMVTGIQAARELRWNQPDAQIIFATSESSFALESFDVNPINYIMKPVEKKKLMDTLDLAIRRVNMDEEHSVIVKVRGGYETVQLHEILYLDYRNHVVSYHLKDGREISTTTLRIGFSEYLKQNHDKSDIIQCHESVAANIGAIDKLTRTDITVRGGEKIPVSNSRYASVADAYFKYQLK